MSVNIYLDRTSDLADPQVTEVTWAVAHKDLDMFVDHLLLLSEAIDRLRTKFNIDF